MEISLKEEELIRSSEDGFDEFLNIIVKAIYSTIGGKITSENIDKINVNQLTLLAYHELHNEVMDGGFIQLIYNGYGGFIFKNPFAKIIKEWGLTELSKLIRKCYKPYSKYHKMIELDCSDEEFMELFERYDVFDQFDDQFIENEEKWTRQIASYVDQNLEKFIKIEK